MSSNTRQWRHWHVSGLTCIVGSSPNLVASCWLSHFSSVQIHTKRNCQGLWVTCAVSVMREFFFSSKIKKKVRTHVRRIQGLGETESKWNSWEMSGRGGWRYPNAQDYFWIRLKRLIIAQIRNQKGVLWAEWLPELAKGEGCRDRFELFWSVVKIK